MDKNAENPGEKLEKFILIIQGSNLSNNGRKDEVPRELLKNLGCDKGTLPSCTTVQKWYAKKDQYRKPNVLLTDFTKSELNDEKFIDFLSKKLEDTWIDLREKLKDIDSRFDIEQEVGFYYEVLVYFLELMNLPIPNDIRFKHAQESQMQKEATLRKKLLNPEVNKPKSGLVFSYNVSPHFNQMVKSIRDNEFSDWEKVVDEVLSYKKTSEMQMKNFSNESIEKGLDTLRKIWLNPDDANNILAAIRKL